MNRGPALGHPSQVGSFRDERSPGAEGTLFPFHSRRSWRGPATPAGALSPWAGLCTRAGPSRGGRRGSADCRSEAAPAGADRSLRPPPETAGVPHLQPGRLMEKIPPASDLEPVQLGSWAVKLVAAGPSSEWPALERPMAPKVPGTNTVALLVLCRSWPLCRPGRSVILAALSS